MIALLAPSKTMDFDSEPVTPDQVKEPLFKDKTGELVNLIKNYDVEALMALMKVSKKIGEENFIRFKNFSSGSNSENQRVSIYALKGDTYKGLDAKSFNKKELFRADDNLRILSGLYGIFSPLTLIEPYRLEMGLKVDISGVKKISDFWKESVTEELNNLLSKREEKVIIDLASAEYMASVDKKRVDGNIIDIVFRENRDGKLKTIAVYSKKARGMMANFIVKQQIKKPNDLKEFNSEGYRFDGNLSNTNSFVFVRNS